MLIYKELDRVVDFSKIPEIDAAANLVADIIKEQRLIYVVGDLDSDGVNATTIGKVAIELMGGVVKYITNDRNKPRGVNDILVDQILRTDDIGLIITCDHGSGDSDRFERLKRERPDIKIIATDHHECSRELPDGKPRGCDFFINQQRPSVESYGKELNGACILYLLLVRTAEILKFKDKWFNQITPSLSITIISDVMSVTDELNIALYTLGIYNIRSLKDERYTYLLAMGGVTSQITSRLIGISIAPLLNSPGRMNQSKKAVDFLTAVNDIPAFGNIVVKLNRDRKNTLNSAIKEARRSVNGYRTIFKHGAVSLLTDGKYSGIAGILAGTFAEQYKTPSVVLTVTPDKIGGSARGYTYDVLGIFEKINKKDHTILTGFDGHKVACGVGVNVNKLDDFLEAFAYQVSLLPPPDLTYSPVRTLEAKSVGLKELMEILQDEPHGKTKEIPLWEFTGKLTKVQALGLAKTHAVLSVDGLDCFYMNGGIDVSKFKRGDTVSVYGSLGIGFSGDLSVSVKGVEYIGDNK